MAIMRSLTINRVTPWVLVCVLMCVLIVMWVLPVTAQKQQPQKPSNTFKDFLVQHQGHSTTLGTLTKVATDYIVVEEDGVSAFHPLQAIQTVKLLKQEEGGTTKLEIKLLAKD